MTSLSRGMFSTTASFYFPVPEDPVWQPLPRPEGHRQGDVGPLAAQAAGPREVHFGLGPV